MMLLAYMVFFLYQNIYNSCKYIYFYHIMRNNMMSMEPYFISWTLSANYRWCLRICEGQHASLIKNRSNAWAYLLVNHENLQQTCTGCRYGRTLWSLDSEVVWHWSTCQAPLLLKPQPPSTTGWPGSSCMPPTPTNRFFSSASCSNTRSWPLLRRTYVENATEYILLLLCHMSPCACATLLPLHLW
jgi:hypothetical protein